MALNDKAVGKIKFAVHPYVVEPEDDVCTTITKLVQSFDGRKS
jgi:hypothetical protein